MLPYLALKESDPTDIQSLVSLYAASFFKWRSKGSRATAPLEKTFKSWWVVKGPINIETEQSRVLRQDIWNEILTVHNDKPQTDG